MKRFFSFFFITIIFASFFLTGCSFDNTSDVEEQIPDTTNQVIEDAVVDYSTLSFTELEVLAYEEDPLAEYYLGLIYEYGNEDVNQDFTKAMEWYEKSAAHDNADATCALGYFYLTGTGVEASLTKANSYFEAAVELGSTDALVGLGRAILAGIDEEELKAASNPPNKEPVVNEPEAEPKSEEEVENQEPDELHQKLLEAVDYIQQAADAGCLDGVYYLGYLYENGIGVEGSYETALSCYVLAASSDSVNLIDQYAINSSNVAIGLLYMNDCVALEDVNTEEETEAEEKAEEKAKDKLALEYFEKAADKGFVKGMFYCGQIYENGLGVDQDYEKAMEYYLSAAESDYAPALNQIGYLYYSGYGVDVDYSSAVYYQKLAALQGYAPAQVNLGYLYENGYGVERNLDTALSYYELAANAGFEGANDAAIRVRAMINVSDTAQ